LATTQTQPVESAAVCGTDSCTESDAKGKSQSGMPNQPLGKFWQQNQMPSQWENSGIRIKTASQWANSGTRIRRHPNGQILAPESDGIPMGKFWHQNQMAFLAAKSDGIPMGKQILAPESNAIPIFWIPSIQPMNKISRGLRISLLIGYHLLFISSQKKFIIFTKIHFNI
jgi:hypothetical protein